MSRSRSGFLSPSLPSSSLPHHLPDTFPPPSHFPSPSLPPSPQLILPTSSPSVHVPPPVPPGPGQMSRGRGHTGAGGSTHGFWKPRRICAGGVRRCPVQSGSFAPVPRPEGASFLKLVWLLWSRGADRDLDHFSLLLHLFFPVFILLSLLISLLVDIPLSLPPPHPSVLSVNFLLQSDRFATAAKYTWVRPYCRWAVF